MMTNLLRLLVLAAACLGAGLSQASAQSAWVVNGTGSRAYAEVASLSRGSVLRLACEESVSLYLYPPRAWDGGGLDDIALTIDGERYAVVADGVDQGVVLSDRPGGAVGVTGGLLARMKRGDSLVVSGAATRRIAVAQLTFPLDGAGAAISAFERRCPSAR